ncbi:hypothetical protein [Lysobacter sp. CA199]|uniref:hypothetical protein n=1 Tax=Lysobacter sp. CA199 TaxID=3455608 RepID=UPI003F8CFBDB
MNQPFAEDAIFVRLPTLASLEECWAQQRAIRPYVANGMTCPEGQRFLNQYEWVFAPTKAALIEAMTRWDQVGICVRWYDWKGDANAIYSYEEHFRDYEERRERGIAEGTWTLQDEVDHVEYSPERYTGEWVIDNLPDDMGEDWFAFGHRSIIDQTLPTSVVTRLLQERTFDDWRRGDAYDVMVRDAKSVGDEIEYWRGEKRAGEDYYGKENESRS